MGDGPIVGQIFFVEVIFFRRGMKDQALNRSGKTPVLIDMFIMVVEVGKTLISIV